MAITGLFLLAFLYMGCNWKVPQKDEGLVQKDTGLREASFKSSLSPDSFRADNAKLTDTAAMASSPEIQTGPVTPDELVGFAETLLGVPYVYASTDPKVGFDCSGFITYVFNHFNIPVPRSSVDFTQVGQTVPVERARRGDIILFTGTNPAERHVGHMGLVVSNDRKELQFIHSTSGKAMGVTVTPLNEYYKTRFVRIARIFPQNNQ